MTRRSLVVLAVTGGIALPGSGFGCAVGSDGTDSVLETDPNLPGLDASYDPTRADGGKSILVPEAGASDNGGKTPDPPGPSTDAGGDPSKDASTPIVNPPVTAPKPSQGEVLVTEVMYDPFGTEPDDEWFELYNAASTERSLAGLTIADGGGRTHTIAKGTTIAAGAYVVFVRSVNGATSGKVPSSAIVYEYGGSLPSNAGIQLANGSTGGLFLKDGGTVVAKADYGGWFSMSGGSSIQLKQLTFSASAGKSNWCVSYYTWSSGSPKGSPGAAQDCP